MDDSPQSVDASMRNECYFFFLSDSFRICGTLIGLFHMKAQKKTTGFLSGSQLSTCGASVAPEDELNGGNFNFLSRHVYK